MITRFLLTLIAISASLPLLAADRPNILYIYVDDMGWGSLGPNGQWERKEAGQPHLVTPHLDQIARQGMNFRRGYGAPVCSPARSSQQTGFHQGHTFADRNDPDNAKKAIRAEDVTMGDVLSEAGYATAYWGKWGYGGSKDMEAPTIDNIQTLPNSHGYQEILAELHHVRAHTFFQPTLWADSRKGLKLVPNSMSDYLSDDYPQEPALQSHADYPEVAYCDDVYAFAALDFIREQAQTDDPFFALLALQVPHSPFDEVEQLPEWDRDYREFPWFAELQDQSKQWAAMITRIDGHIGNLLAALEDPNADGDTSDSVAEDTLIIFQSDNGGPGGHNNKEFDANGGLSGNKGSVQEGGIRVPTMMRWPGKIEASSSSDKVIDVTDLLPTFCDLAGVRRPVGLDGVSIAPVLTGEGDPRPRPYVIHEASKSGQSVIHGDWKLVNSSKNGQRLYSLAEDRSESTDVAADHPELVEQLAEILLAEKTDQPKGFTNTYHHWQGDKTSDFLDAANWSDYTYINADITYIEETGPPADHWTATIPAKTKAKTSASAELLSLDIAGEMTIGKSATLSGRNELRVAPRGVLRIAGGKATSARWLEVEPKGRLVGRGTVDCDLYLAGKLIANGTIEVTGTAHLLPGSTIVPNGQRNYTLLEAETLIGDLDPEATFPNWKLKKDGNKIIAEYTP